MHRWQLQEAKAKLSRLLRLSQEEGPQEITVRGKPTAVVLSRDDYDRLAGKKPSFLELLRSSPLVGLDLDLARDRSTVREVVL